ncbi:MAG TPA: hypothetical protein VFK85_03585 [Anaeromyxobacteraceae bacterium]|nr:hypothetical protein [Anaeromyxobacteraceae bacterium]
MRPSRCDEVVMGACVVSNAQPFEATYVERSIRLALAYWNAPEDTLAGWAIVYGTQEIDCGSTTGASGCAWWDENRTIELQVLDPDCPETAQLVHEIGHVLHHDGGHTGPWWNWTAEQNATWDVVRLPGASPGCAVSRYYVTRQ